MFLVVTTNFVSVASGSFIFFLEKNSHDVKSLDCKNVVKKLQKPVVSPDEAVKATDSDEISHEKPKKDGANEEEIPLEILSIGVHYSKNLVAFCTSTKHLLVIDANCLILLHSFHLEKQATSVTFCTRRNTLLVADRSGNVTEYDYDRSKGNIVLGHISIILDLLLSPDEKFLLTCDRDEKIRVSHWPNAYNIERFCLCHSEYVRTLCWTKFSQKQELLASGSGDGCINIWNYKQGTLLHSFNCDSVLPPNQRISKMVSLSCVSSVCLIATFEKSSKILCLKFVPGGGDEDANSINLSQHAVIEAENIIADVCAFTDGQFLILCICESTPIRLFQIDQEEFNVYETKHELCDDFSSNFEFLTTWSKLLAPSSVEKSEKMRFDNIKERKRTKYDSSQ